MMDKDAGFPLLEIYDDAPTGTTKEDAVAPSPSKKARRTSAQDAVTAVGDKLCQAMTSGFEAMADAMKTVAKTGQPTSSQVTGAYEEASSDIMNEIDKGLETIQKLEDHISDLKVRMDTARSTNNTTDVVAGRYERRVLLLEQMLEQAESNLEGLMSSINSVRTG